MRKIIIYPLILLCCCTRPAKATAYNFADETNHVRQNLTNSVYLDGKIDTSFQDVVALMNSVVYSQYKNKAHNSNRTKRDKPKSDMRYPADSINFIRAAENYFESKNSLSDKGIDFNFQYTNDAMLNYGVKNMGNFDIKMSFDLDKLLEMNRLKLFFYVFGDYGDKVRNLTGVAQGISNIEAPATWKVYQLWLEQNLFDDKLSLLLGLYDLNSEFDCRDASAIFINPSQAIGADFSQSGQNGPSIFPTTSLALRVKYNFLTNFTLHSAAFDGVPGDPQNPYGTHVILNKNEGVLITNELDYQRNNSSGAGFLKLAAGSWLFTSKFEDLTDVDYSGSCIKRKDNLGFYFFEEQKIMLGEGFPADELSYYLRTGIANGNVNQFDSYYGGGITFKGICGRKDDIFGIAFSFAHNGSKYRSISSFTSTFPGKVNPFETVWEATYNFQVNSYIAVQPDIQYVNHPSFNCNKDNLLLSFIRLKLSY